MVVHFEPVPSGTGRTPALLFKPNSFVKIRVHSWSQKIEILENYYK
jgi:hypothetical protein